MSQNPLEKVALAISAYRSDDQVIALLAQAFRDGSTPFGAVIVVDSQGSGRIGDEAKSRGWPIRYESSRDNLGSAGNLARRLTLSAETGCDWCLALNHDGEVDAAKAIGLVDCARRHPDVGAVYPRLRLTSAGNRLDRPRRSFAAASSQERIRSNDSEDTEVKWSSSNGALYALAPVRQGMHLWPELWMGYEDLALGWELDQRGLTQWLCGDVVVDDNYEFRTVPVLGRDVNLADKAPWYEYYGTRNILLIARRTGFAAVGVTGVVRRWITDLALIIVTREEKRRRLNLWARGWWAGLTDRTGKGPVP